ncbi:transmembrane protein [Cyclospora cayetanensis]|uniref:Transmembrane protein n=1 Tax=Cyclospora cayetanensis TaxID=88456 RepID=A0A1D3D6Y5_9EIME|nr:transmembrane protein [Cyclospora cayetanensis]
MRLLTLRAFSLCCLAFLCIALCVSACSGSLLDIGRGRRGGGEGSGAGDSGVVRCSFIAGTGSPEGGPSGAPLSSFFVPASDRAMYEEGLRDYLQQIGAQASELSVVCAPYLSSEPLTCQLCMYNEVSRDLKHVRHGQVLSSLLPQCMQGAFEQAFKMPLSQYHPICYPEEKTQQATQDTKQQQIVQHGADGSCSSN